MSKRVRDSPLLKKLESMILVPKGQMHDFEKHGGVGR